MLVCTCHDEHQRLLSFFKTGTNDDEVGSDLSKEKKKAKNVDVDVVGANLFSSSCSKSTGRGGVYQIKGWIMRSLHFCWILNFIGSRSARF